MRLILLALAASGILLGTVPTVAADDELGRLNSPLELAAEVFAKTWWVRGHLRDHVVIEYTGSGNHADYRIDIIALPGTEVEGGIAQLALPYEIHGNTSMAILSLQTGHRVRVCPQSAVSDPASLLEGYARHLRCDGDMDGDGDADLYEINTLRDPFRPAPGDRLLPDEAHACAASGPSVDCSLGTPAGPARSSGGLYLEQDPRAGLDAEFASERRVVFVCVSQDPLRTKGCLEDTDRDGRLFAQEVLACSDPTDPRSHGSPGGDPLRCEILPLA